MGMEPERVTKPTDRLMNWDIMAFGRDSDTGKTYCLPCKVVIENLQEHLKDVHKWT